MIIEYITAALQHAHYEIIEGEEPYYGEIPDLPGVWATGTTLEECRKNLAEVVDDWLVIQLRRGISIPPIDGITTPETPYQARPNPYVPIR
ncbi:type II toxin-antitoxin system HicB family antitoxin [Methanofollis formosanus]|uniref:Type II toxin-antitoxin system HicB family antitoxin n=1 Tax=Methanofollis formosanus TaxID=299308 RepID=A0A8G1EG09_9EURY|nr:type II toxin-antitoxin system HicB family antitoxin [Methanofollis formosanus]QYZ78661.1 type II toxin-antitoxin system HicB family antitoxin [Methanofollis formosanus]